MSIEQQRSPGPSTSWSLGKHLALGLLTGGLSLFFYLGCRLPSLWEQVCLLRADWINKGRDPHTWEWIGRGWMATVGTLFVIFPAAMFLTVCVSLVFPGVFFRPPSGHISPVIICALIIPLSAMAIGLAVILTWLWHTLRQSCSLIWSWTKFSAPQGSNL